MGDGRSASRELGSPAEGARDPATAPFMDDHDAASETAAQVHRGRLQAPGWISAAAILAGPLTGAVVALALSSSDGVPAEAGSLTLVALLAGALIAGREPMWARLLPLMGALARASGP